MRFFICMLLALFFTLFYVEGSGAVGGRDLKNPHDYRAKSKCILCHTAEPPELSFDAVSTCTKCHEGYIVNHPVAGHPIGKVPEAGVSSVMHLSSEGEMVCHTCHDQHNRLKRPKMLRVPYLKLCASCHRGY
jgi:predicted CXXCH cytochrome family protein